jgi:hypothetical protein
VVAVVVVFKLAMQVIRLVPEVLEAAVLVVHQMQRHLLVQRIPAAVVAAVLIILAWVVLVGLVLLSSVLQSLPFQQQVLPQ